MKRSFYARFSLLILALFLVLVPSVALLAMRAMQHSSNDVADWLPETFESTQKIHWFAEHFVSDDLLMVSWKGCTLTDPRVAKLAERLRQPVEMPDGQSQVLARQVFTGPEVLEQLRDEPLNLSRKVALGRLRGWLVGEDLLHGSKSIDASDFPARWTPPNGFKERPFEQTALVVMVTEAGWEQRHFFIEQITKMAKQVGGIEADDLMVAGTTADAVAIDVASHKHLNLMMGVCYGVSCLLMVWLFRDVVLTVSVFLTALFCQQVSLALIEVTGGHVDSVMLMIPSLLYVLSVSAGVHLVNYYRDDFAAGSPESAVTRAVQQAWLPCVLAALTTALGLGSLSVSVLTPVRNFGIYAALGVVVAVLIVFSLLPAMLQFFSVPRLAQKLLDRGDQGSESRWDRVLDWVGRFRTQILWVALLLLGMGLWGITRIQTSARVHDFFSSDAKLIRDYNALETLIGPLVPLEVIVRMPAFDGEAGEVSLLDRMRIVGAIHGTLEKHEGVGTAVSALNFSAPIGRRRRNALAVSREAVLENQMVRNLENFEQLGFLKRTAKEQLWRISARAYAGDRRNYAELLEELQASVEPVLRRNADRGWGEIEVVYCGGVPLVQQTQEQMLRDLIKSFALAFVLIGAMMILLMLVGSARELLELQSLGAWLGWGLRRALAGLVAMIPNVMPCVVVLGAMGLLGMKLGIGSIMTASVALGIAVDDTLHFITWFRRGMNQGQSRAEAVRFAVQRCATAMTQTSLICGLGMLSFAASDFVPIARFAWLMFAMLLMALWADLVVLPALLLSRLGALFEPQSAKKMR